MPSVTAVHSSVSASPEGPWGVFWGQERCKQGQQVGIWHRGVYVKERCEKREMMQARREIFLQRRFVGKEERTLGRQRKITPNIILGWEEPL